jgi:hypothetical protein
VIADNPFPQESTIHEALRASGLRVVTQMFLSDTGNDSRALSPTAAADARSICGSRKIWSIAAA